MFPCKRNDASKICVHSTIKSCFRAFQKTNEVKQGNMWVCILFQDKETIGNNNNNNKKEVEQNLGFPGLGILEPALISGRTKGASVLFAR